MPKPMLSALPWWWLALSACQQPGGGPSDPNPPRFVAGDASSPGDGALGCTPGGRSCRQGVPAECQPDGSWKGLDACPQAQVCSAGSCIACESGKNFCGGDDGNQVWRCQEDGTSSLLTACPVGTQCEVGFCVNPCSADVKFNSNMGCDYYAVDLENGYGDNGRVGDVDPANAQFAVIVSNPDEDKTVSVSIHETFGSPPLEGHTYSLAPGALAVAKLPARNLKGTMRGKHAWYITGTRPFIAYQFNPLDNTHKAYSNDASLLLPGAAVDRDYIVVTGQQRAYVTAVGVHEGTEVTFVPTAPTAAGDDVPALAAGESWSTTLEPGEVLNLHAVDDGVPRDLSGTEVNATKPVIVFAGSVMAISADACCADHLEHQMLPVSKWGKTHVAARSVPRGLESDYWRIVGSVDGTAVTFFPGNIHAAAVLGRGQMLEVKAQASFVVTADQPVMVAQILASSFEVTAQGAYCAADVDCTTGQVCLGGQCTATCSYSQGSCPSAAYGCVSAGLFGADADLGGLCKRRRCETGDPSCPASAVCSDAFVTTSFCATECSSDWQCQEADGFCGGIGLCSAPPCEADADCPSGARCMGADGADPGQCFYVCTPPADCPDKGYLCAPPDLFTAGSRPDPSCIPPFCDTNADCPGGHTCRHYDDYAICETIGDPALLLAVPVEQFRDSYVFLTPDAYLEDYASIIAPEGAVVTLDGKELPASFFEGVGQGWSATSMPVSDGVHRLTATQPVGVSVYGYDDDVSYGYPAGTGLSDVNK